MAKALNLSEVEYKARRAEICKNWRLRNPEKMRDIQRDSYQKKIDKQGRDNLLKYHRDRGLRRRYGITSEQFEKHRCAICGSDDPKGKGNFHVDHCHDTSKIRGLLCSPCNTGIGHLKHNTEILRAPAAYLEQQNG